MKDLFLKLVKIPSPSGQESAVAEFVTNYLISLGWKVSHDKKGNVIAKLPPKAKKVLLVAHLDTVQKPNQLVKPIFKNGAKAKGIFKQEKISGSSDYSDSYFFDYFRSELFIVLF